MLSKPRASSANRLCLAGVAVLSLCGVLFVLRWLDGTGQLDLPAVFKIPSKGAPFGAFATSPELGANLLSTVLFALLLVSAVPLWRYIRGSRLLHTGAAEAASAAGLSDTARASVTGSSRHHVAIVLMLGFLWGLFLSYPMSFSTNWEAHWVAFTHPNNPYSAMPIAHVRLLFYEFPYILYAIAHSVAAAYTFLITRLLTQSAIPAMAAAAGVATAAPLMGYYVGMTEDVVLAVSAPLALTYHALRSQLFALFAAAVASMLIRLQLGAIACAAVFVAPPVTTVIQNLQFRTLPANLISAIGPWRNMALTGLAAAALTAWLVWASGTTSVTPLEQHVVDGYKHRAFSGVYLLHSAWVYPLLVWPVVALSCYDAFAEKSGPAGAQWPVFAVGTALLVIVNIIFFESSTGQQFYYNVRYLLYPLPWLIILVTAFLWRSSERVLPRSGLGSILVIAWMAVILFSSSPATFERVKHHASQRYGLGSPAVRYDNHAIYLKRHDWRRDYSPKRILVPEERKRSASPLLYIWHMELADLIIYRSEEELRKMFSPGDLAIAHQDVELANAQLLYTFRFKHGLYLGK